MHEEDQEELDKLRQELADGAGVPIERVTTFVCGNRCKHRWDGPIVDMENGSSSSCSLCGALAIDEAMWQ